MKILIADDEESIIEVVKIYLEKDETQDDRDVYNRLLRYVYLRDRTLINKKMIAAADKPGISGGYFSSEKL